MAPLRSTGERVVELIGAVVTGVGGGAITVQHFRLQECADSATGLLALVHLTLGNLTLRCVYRVGQSHACSSPSLTETGMPGSMRSPRK